MENANRKITQMPREREQGDMKKKCTMEMEHYGLRNESNRSKCSNICALSVEK